MIIIPSSSSFFSLPQKDFKSFPSIKSDLVITLEMFRFLYILHNIFTQHHLSHLLFIILYVHLFLHFFSSFTYYIYNLLLLLLHFCYLGISISIYVFYMTVIFLFYLASSFDFKWPIKNSISFFI